MTTTMQSKTPSQSWTFRSRPKHPHKLDCTPTTMSTQETHSMVSPWRSWNPTSPGYTASCSGSSTPLKWKRNSISRPRIASKGWWQKETNMLRETSRIKTLHPPWMQSSILKQRGSVTGLGILTCQ